MLKQLNKLRSLFDRRDKLRFVGLLALMVVGSLFEAIGVGAIPAFIATLAIPDRVLGNPMLGPVIEGLRIDATKELVLWGSLGLILIFLVKNVFTWYVYQVQTQTAEEYRVRLADQLFAAYIHAPYEFHLGRNSAELLRNVNSETKEILNGVINPLLSAIMAGLMTFFIVALILVTTPVFAWGGVVLVGAGSWGFLRYFKGRLHRYGLEAQDERRAGLQAVNQGLSAIVDARVLGREQYFIDVHHRSARQFARVNCLRNMIAKASTPMLEFIAVVGMLAVVIIMAALEPNLNALVPTLALFGAAIVRLRSSISVIVSQMSQVRYSIYSIDPVCDDIKLLRGKARKPAVPAGGGEAPRLRFEQAIELRGVAYQYPAASTPALQDISLRIEKGSSVAFVGSTGSGKTTLVSLLLGLLKPQQGQILVDGADIYANLDAWHRYIGYIPQSIYLLDDTIRRNIAFGLPDEAIDDEQLWKAIRAAQLEAYVRSLDDGADTIVGERGIRLSGGQRQRIGLARALYHDPDVIIMDEATSALDNKTENLVMEALESLKQERTFIMIAHRLSTVRNCDRLYFLSGGRVEAAGTYDELVGAHLGFREMADVA